MSDAVIFSDDCLAEIKVSEEYYPILCQSEMRFSIKQEIVLATTPNSGLSRDKRARLSESFATISGLSPINNGTNISVFYIVQESIRTAPQDIRLTYTDQEGNIKQINGTAIIANIEIGASIGDFAEATIDFEFTGGIILDAEVVPPSGDTLYSDTWDTTEGQSYISGLSTGLRDGTQYSLVGKEIIEVDREGMQYDFIGNNATPGNRQCSWNTSLNRLVFQYDFNSGETVFVIFK